MFRVLQPRYEKTGEITNAPEGPIHWNRAVLEHVGFAANMTDALQQFPRGRKNGYSPVLEWVGNVH